MWAQLQAMHIWVHCRKTVQRKCSVHIKSNNNDDDDDDDYDDEWWYSYKWPILEHNKVVTYKELVVYGKNQENTLKFSWLTYFLDKKKLR